MPGAFTRSCPRSRMACSLQGLTFQGGQGKGAPFHIPVPAAQPTIHNHSPRPPAPGWPVAGSATSTSMPHRLTLWLIELQAVCLRGPRVSRTRRCLSPHLADAAADRGVRALYSLPPLPAALGGCRQGRLTPHAPLHTLQARIMQGWGPRSCRVLSAGAVMQTVLSRQSQRLHEACPCAVQAWRGALQPTAPWQPPHLAWCGSQVTGSAILSGEFQKLLLPVCC